MVSRLVFVVMCRLLVDHLSLHFLFLFFCFRPGCCTLCRLLLFRPILRFLRCMLFLLLFLLFFLFLPLHLLLRLRSLRIFFLLLRYIAHLDIFVRILLMHRTRGLYGRPGGRLFTKGLGALHKDSWRRHRSIPLGVLRLFSRVLILTDTGYI